MTEGYINIKPEIEFINTENKLIQVSLKDGRKLIIPLDKFKSIKKLNIEQRKKIQIIGADAFTFDDCAEVYHLEQLLGSYTNYKHN